MMNPQRETLLRDYEILTRQGFRVIPVGSDKRPRGILNSWKPLVTESPSTEERERWAAHPRTQGWAILAGNREERVFVVDVERAGMDEPAILAALNSLPASCQRPTANGGQHAYLRLLGGAAIETQDLASRADEVLLAEVRGCAKAVEGAGAYAVVTGPGRGPLNEDFAPHGISRSDADELLDRIRALDVPKPSRPTKPTKTPTGDSPRGGDTGQLLAEAILDGSLSWTQVLDDGWHLVSNRGGRIGLLRPDYGEKPKSEESANAVGAVLAIHSTAVPWSRAQETFNPALALSAARFRGVYADAMRAVEDAATAYVTGDESLPSWAMSWPADLLRRVHDAREAARREWAAERERAITASLNEWITPDTSTEDTVTEEEFDGGADPIFDSTPILAYVRDYARAQMVSPFALLAAVLARVVASISPEVRIPPFIGSPASLNSYFALVGPSGAGKTAAADVAAQLLPGQSFTVKTPSSGEGIIALFVDVEKGVPVQHTHNVLSIVDEVATLAAQQDRQGSTLGSILRSAWSGATLSTNGADRNRRRHLHAHSYRFVAVVGVQPATAHYLLNDQGAGTPQRIIWLPATDKHAPDVDLPRPEVDLLTLWRPPVHKPEIGFPDSVRDLVRRVRLNALRGNVSELDGHALLAREKLAAALALLHGEADVSDELWDVSGLVMRVSDRTRESLLRYEAAEARKRVERQGRTDAQREAVKQTHGLENAILTAARYVHRNAGGVSRRQLKDSCGRWRGLANEAITEAVTRGLIREELVEHANGRQTGKRYFPGKVKP